MKRSFAPYFRAIYGGNRFETKKPNPAGWSNPAARAASRSVGGPDGEGFRRGNQKRTQCGNVRVRVTYGFGAEGLHAPLILAALAGVTRLCRLRF